MAAGGYSQDIQVLLLQAGDVCVVSYQGGVGTGVFGTFS